MGIAAMCRRMGGSAAGMVPCRIASEYKHLTLREGFNPVRGNAVGIISPGIGATHRHLLLTASLGVKVTVHTLVVGALGRTVAVPCVGCTHNIVVKLHDMVDGKLHRHLDHIVARAHIGEGPTLFLELLDEMTQRLTRPLAGSILHAIGDDGVASNNGVPPRG